MNDCPGGIGAAASRELLAVLTAVKRGDFSARYVVETTGVAAQIASTLNEIIQKNERMTDEIDRISEKVGKKGRLEERAALPAATGGWRSIVDSVNELVGDLGQPISEVERVIGAVAKGDLTQKVDLEPEGRLIQGEFLRTAKMVNTMVDQLSSFADEVTRVAREVGTEGKLGGQAVVPGVSGTWKDLTDNVNSMASNLTSQVRNIAEVTTAVATGDLSKKITVDVKGEILELKDTINTMVDQLSSFADEVTRVAREVGTEGKLGGQARVKGVIGHVEGSDRQRELDGVEPDEPGAQHRRSHDGSGDGRPVQEDHRRGAGRNRRAQGHDQHDGRPARLVRQRGDARGPRGRHRRQARRASRRRRRQSGTWRDLTDNVNSMASNLTTQVRGVAEVVTAVARGNLSQQLQVEAKGEILELKDTINTMVDQLSSFADEVTRVAREVGTEGKLGGQAQVPGVVGHVGRPDRQRELDGVEPDEPGARDRRSHDGGGDGRPVQEDHRRGARRDRRARRRRSTRWWISCRALPTK